MRSEIPFQYLLFILSNSTQTAKPRKRTGDVLIALWLVIEVRVLSWLQPEVQHVKMI